MVKQVSEEKDAVVAPRSNGWIARGIIALALIAAVPARLAARLDDPPYPLDFSAIRNLIMLISCFVAGLTAWGWFCFRSSFPRRLRLGVASITGLAMVALVAVILALGATRVIQFSGTLAPRLAPGEHDAAVFASESSTGQADFNRHTPNDFPQFLGPERTGWISGSQLASDWPTNPPRQLWKRPVGAGWSAFAAANGFAVTQEQRGNEECVVCYEIETGKPVWSKAIEARHETALGGIGPRSTPTIHEGRLYVLGATGVLRCLDGSGNLLWNDDLRKRYGITDTDDEQNVSFGRAASPL